MPDQADRSTPGAQLAHRRSPASGDGGGVVCVLGMHRSGTSCLAGSLEEAGLALGNDIVKEAPYNRKGNRENPQIMALHEDLLASNGGSWHVPPAAVRWAQEHRDRQARIIASYRELTLWGFKDPRTLLVLDGWREALPGLRFAATFRHPLAVARSLQARDGFSLEKGIDLWIRYNRILLRSQAAIGFDVISFDREPAAYRARLSDVARRLGLSPPREGLTFLEPRLRHDAAERAGSLPSEAAAIYSALKALDDP